MRKIKAQDGTPSAYMVKRMAQEKVREDIRRKKDSISQRGLNASNIGRDKKLTMEEYKKKSAEKAPYQGVSKADWAGDQKKEGPNILQKIGSTFSKPHCIFSDENKSGCNSGESAGYKNGGTMKKAQNGTKVPEAKDTAPAKKAKAILDKQKAALKKKGYAKNGGRITSKKK